MKRRPCRHWTGQTLQSGSSIQIPLEDALCSSREAQNKVGREEEQEEEKMTGMGAFILVSAAQPPPVSSWSTGWSAGLHIPRSRSRWWRTWPESEPRDPRRNEMPRRNCWPAHREPPPLCPSRPWPGLCAPYRPPGRSGATAAEKPDLGSDYNPPHSGQRTHWNGSQCRRLGNCTQHTRSQWTLHFLEREAALFRHETWAAEIKWLCCVFPFDYSECQGFSFHTVTFFLSSLDWEGRLASRLWGEE